VEPDSGTADLSQLTPEKTAAAGKKEVDGDARFEWEYAESDIGIRIGKIHDGRVGVCERIELQQGDN
jgi:hypothetical protein